MPAHRTSVRYKGTRCGLCSYCGCSHARRLCAYPACYIYSRWRRPRAPLGLPCGRLIYPHRFALLFAIPFRFSIFRLVLRLVLRVVHRFLSCVSPYPSRLVVSCSIPCFISILRPVLRLVLLRVVFVAYPWAVFFIWHRFALLAARFVRAVSSFCVSSCVSFVRIALRCGSFVSPWRLVLRPVFIACRGMRYGFHTWRRFALLAARRLAFVSRVRRLRFCLV